MSSYDPPEGEPLQARPSGGQRLDSDTQQPAADDGSSPYGGGAPPDDRKPPGSSSKLLVRLVVLVLLAVGGWYYFGQSRAGATSEEQSPMYQKHVAGASLTPARLSAADIDKARGEATLRGEPIPFLANPSAEFQQNVKDGKVEFYAVRLYDTCYEDGDVVTLKLSSGVEMGPVPLTNSGTTISIPVVAGEAPQVTVIGIRDGTGGITVGVQSSGGMWYSGVIPEGGSQSMPLTVR